ncbi:aminotransferase class V-fold PLP-dependent enzyme [Acidipila sp. EB88]|uniref:pyridoxal phosphate-dependent decarboxylase family protein n=1 Tax=Acidipila sp. EB88 TaxID=2305226 RepID=UPI000F5F0C03|nr:aminotransferase class V-fold PLP-dependent enzyme [Acidipila sp. EB88]RRA49853.1 aspartate aminotransferase family protein [Acidipila sp. EB88]
MSSYRDDLAQEVQLIRNADDRAAEYLRQIGQRRVFPSDESLAGLAAFDEALPEHGKDPAEGLALLDEKGSPATVATNDPRYFGFVIGAALPAAAAAERLMLSWDQSASLFLGSPVAAKIEKIAANWLLEILDLPRESAVGFGTSATACTLACIAAARRSILARQGWDVDDNGLTGAPEVEIVISETAHITVKKALRVLGFGLKRIHVVPCDPFGRLDPSQLPPLSDRTILVLQAGEVNTGEFDAFKDIVPLARAAGAWVHVDGAFGLWARASSHAHLTEGIEQAESWTTDGHKWLNTPYDCAMAICRDADALAGAMNSDAVYSSASPDAQKNLTLEFSRRPRGIPVWAALRSLGKAGVAEMVERHCSLARQIAEGLEDAGFTVLNRVVLNQVLACATNDEETKAVIRAAQDSGEMWFGASVWQGRAAFRISVSSWRTSAPHVEKLIALMKEIRRQQSQ